MDKIRYGIIGLGNQGTHYALKIFDNGNANDACVSAMCDINPSKIENMREKTSNTEAVYFENYIKKAK